MKKLISIYKYAVMLGLLMIFPGATLSAKEKKSSNGRETLYVVYADSSPNGTSNVAVMNSREKRKYTFTRNFKKILEAKDWKVNLEFVTSTSNLPEHSYMMVFELLSLRVPTPGEVQMRYKTMLVIGTKGKNLGIKVIDEYPNYLMTSQFDRTIDEMYQEAADGLAANVEKYLFKK